MKQLWDIMAEVMLTSVSFAAGNDFQCPQNVVVTEAAQGIPKNWRIVQDHGGPRLFYISMSYADGIDVRADYEKELPHNRTKYTWDLNAVVKREPWFVRCEYKKTSIILLVPVSSDLKFCTTTQENAADQKVDPVMHCR